MAEKIIFDGRSYNSVSEIPPDVRQMYERLKKLFTDANRDGVPDVVQQGGIESVKELFGFFKDMAQTTKSGKTWTQEQLVLIQETDAGININGRTFRSVDEMPLEIRKVYDKVVSEAIPGGAEIFDDSWRERDGDLYSATQDDDISEPGYTNPSPDTVMEPVGVNHGLMMAIAIGVLLCVGLSAYLWFCGAGLF
jgi:hypothetical protein